MSAGVTVIQADAALAELVVVSANIVSHDGYYELDIDAVAGVLAQHRAAGQAELVQALQDIVNPLAALQRDAESQGCRLSGIAYSIANDPEHLKRIARTALSRLSGEVG